MQKLTDKDFELMASLQKDIKESKHAEDKVFGKVGHLPTLANYERDFSCGLMFALKIKGKLDLLAEFISNRASYNTLYFIYNELQRLPKHTELSEIVLPDTDNEELVIAQGFEDAFTTVGNLRSAIG